jgi:hypothetical protein
MAESSWRNYAAVARDLLNRFAEHFGLERVEEKQKIPGQRSGRRIEIDGKGARLGNVGFVLLECKRYPEDRVEAEKLESLAYRIVDTGAEGAIIVSPLGLQEGAQKIAEGEGIVSVQLHEESTAFSFVLRFVNNVMVGVRDDGRFSDAASATIATKTDIR